MKKFKQTLYNRSLNAIILQQSIKSWQEHCIAETLKVDNFNKALYELCFVCNINLYAEHNKKNCLTIFVSEN